MEADLNRQAIRGGVALLKRQVVGKAVGVVAGIWLARLLPPAEFGFYAVATFATSFFNIFGDFGLAASLIRQSDEPTPPEESAVFTAQQVLVAIPFSLLFAFAPLIGRAYQAGTSVSACLRWLAVAAILSSFRSIPAMRLERRLAFETLATIEIIEVCVYQCSALVFANLHFGAVCFPIAVALSQLVGLLFIYLKSPWLPCWRWDWKAVKPRIAFGIKYQGISIVSFVRDSINPLFIGLLAGPTAVGLIGFALTLANYPIWATGILGRVYFPLFARHQRDQTNLGAAVAAAIRLNNVIVIGFTAAFVPIAHIAVPMFFGPKWIPAIPIIYCLLSANVFAATSWPLIALCNAIGEPEIPFAFSVWLTVALWVLSVPLVLSLGILGFGIAIIGTNFLNIPFVRKVHKRVPVDLNSDVWPSIAAGSVVSAAMVAVDRLLPLPPLAQALLLPLFGLAAFFAMANAISKNMLWKEIHEIKTAYFT